MNVIGLRYRIRELNEQAGHLEELVARRGLFTTELLDLAKMYTELRSLELELSKFVDDGLILDGHNLATIEGYKDGDVFIVGNDKNGTPVAAARFTLENGDDFDQELIEAGFAIAAGLAARL